MNKFLKFALSVSIITVSLAVFTSSCEKEFDRPPVYVPPAITPNTTIKDLKALLTTSGNVVEITDDLIIRGIVVADDKSGNYYQSTVIQDETSGILIRMGGTEMYTSYPIGQEVFVKCQGLALGDYNGLVQLGVIDATGTTVETIPSTLFDKYIIKGSAGNVVTPKEVTVADLSTSIHDIYQNTLIKLVGFEFGAADTAKTFANATSNPPASVNFTIKNCSGNSITLRNSGYADFAAINVPNGNGDITAIYTVFGSTKQLSIRDTSDVKFYNNRCVGSGGGNGARITIAALRAMYTSDMKIGAYKIGGVVISDGANKNISNGVVVLQEGNAGIQIYFGGTLSYNVGDSVIVDVTDDSLINYRGSLEIKTPFGTTAPGAVATGKTITPVTRTISEVNSGLSAALNNPANIEFTLTKIAGATATPAGTYAGNKTITDASGNMTLYTANAATFSSSTMPATAADWVGIPSTFGSSKQLQVRNANDVTGGTGGGTGGTVLFEETFESATNNADVAVTGWKNIAETGTWKYQVKTFSNNKYAQLNPFTNDVANQQAVVKSWLITPGVNLDASTGEVLTFKTLDGYANGSTLKVYYSTNYDGGATPWTSTWTELSATIASGAPANAYATSFTNSGDVSLSSITGTVYIAFVYEGGYTNPTQKTTAYQVDDVKITKN